MSYAQYGVIEAGDFNTLIQGYANGTLNTGTASLNLVWSTGNGNKGYGQTLQMQPRIKVQALPLLLLRYQEEQLLI
jgi:hypothetical protein